MQPTAGKTLSFLVPAVEILARAKWRQLNGTGMIAISPTRELASQIREEAEQLLTFHRTGAGKLTSHVVFGGTNVKSDIKAIASAPPALLVATPGRLNDLLYNHGMQPAFLHLLSLIFDEADQLLEMGFRPDLTKILTALQPSAPHRQTLLFSATLPQDVVQVAQFATRQGGCQLIDTVGEEDQATHAHVPQKATVTTLATQTAELVALLQEVTSAEGLGEGGSYKVWRA